MSNSKRKHLPTGDERATADGRASEVCGFDVGSQTLRPEVSRAHRSHQADGGGRGGGLRDAAAAEQPEDVRRQQLSAASEAASLVEQLGVRHGLVASIEQVIFSFEFIKIIICKSKFLNQDNNVTCNL